MEKNREFPYSLLLNGPRLSSKLSDEFRFAARPVNYLLAFNESTWSLAKLEKESDGWVTSESDRIEGQNEQVSFFRRKQRYFVTIDFARRTCSTEIIDPPVAEIQIFLSLFKNRTPISLPNILKFRDESIQPSRFANTFDDVGLLAAGLYVSGSGSIYPPSQPGQSLLVGFLRDCIRIVDVPNSQDSLYGIRAWDVEYERLQSLETVAKTDFLGGWMGLGDLVSQSSDISVEHQMLMKYPNSNVLVRFGFQDGQTSVALRSDVRIAILKTSEILDEPERFQFSQSSIRFAGDFWAPLRFVQDAFGPLLPIEASGLEE